MGAAADAYDVLGLEPGVSSEALRARFHELAKVHHPDRAGGDAAAFAAIVKAHDELAARIPSADSGGGGGEETVKPSDAECGKAAFRQGNYELAIEYFEAALEGPLPSGAPAAPRDKAALYSNLSAAHFAAGRAWQTLLTLTFKDAI
jgi:DnaJ-class molecular chaperone